jgi:ABC-type polysaccharide/polyol phosphate export permease
VLRLFDYRDLIAALVARDLKVRYRRSAIGFLWTMLQPLLMMLVFQVVFAALFRFDIQNSRSTPSPASCSGTSRRASWRR